jgi:hypothetical protein
MAPHHVLTATDGAPARPDAAHAAAAEALPATHVLADPERFTRYVQTLVDSGAGPNELNELMLRLHARGWDWLPTATLIRQQEAR